MRVTRMSAGMELYVSAKERYWTLRSLAFERDVTVDNSV